MNKSYDGRPWGSWFMMEEGNGYWIKKIIVHPGKRLSLQYHLERKEKWTIIQGMGTMTLDLRKFIVAEGDQISIPRGTLHRISNFSEKENLIIIEVAMGNPKEEDIIRVEDDYGRA